MQESRFALEFSVERLLACGDGSGLYFWTFTRRKCENVRRVREEWNKALTYIRRALPRFCGVRVFELHPGGHGLHVHIVTNGHFRVEVIRKALRRTGWGRIHVKHLKKDRARALAGYVAKYVSKGVRPPCLKGWRLWSAFGPFEHCACKDVFYDSPGKRLYQWLSEEIYGWEGMRWYERFMFFLGALHRYRMDQDLRLDRTESGAVILYLRGSPVPSSISATVPSSAAPSAGAGDPRQTFFEYVQS